MLAVFWVAVSLFVAARATNSQPASPTQRTEEGGGRTVSVGRIPPMKGCSFSMAQPAAGVWVRSSIALLCFCDAAPIFVRKVVYAELYVWLFMRCLFHSYNVSSQRDHNRNVTSQIYSQTVRGFHPVVVCSRIVVPLAAPPHAGCSSYHQLSEQPAAANSFEACCVVRCVYLCMLCVCVCRSRSQTHRTCSAT